MSTLRGARVVVTGASSGIGWATAVVLAEAGADLLLTGRDGQRLQTLAATIGGHALPADLADPDQVDRLGVAMTRYAPDVVIHNAGVGLREAAAATARSDLDRVLAVNLRAPMALTAAVLPTMALRRSGHLVFVSSIAGVLGVAQESAYAASKAALTAYASSLRGELAPAGIRVTTVVPGVVDTEFFARRGVPYQRRRPRPITAPAVAQAIIRGIERDRAGVIVPGWLRIPVALHGLAPQTFARFAGRWG